MERVAIPLGLLLPAQLLKAAVGRSDSGVEADRLGLFQRVVTAGAMAGQFDELRFLLRRREEVPESVRTNRS